MEDVRSASLDIESALPGRTVVAQRPGRPSPIVIPCHTSGQAIERQAAKLPEFLHRMGRETKQEPIGLERRTLGLRTDPESVGCSVSTGEG
jgi:hypothetical protein